LKPLGVQLVADMHGCDPAALDDLQGVGEAMLEAARRGGARIVAHNFHRFSPHGISGVVIIAESHLAIHTWPEHRFAAIDLFTCSDSVQPDLCLAYLQQFFRSERVVTSTLRRGELRPPGP